MLRARQLYANVRYIFVGLTLFLAVTFPLSAAAQTSTDTNDFVVTDFAADYALSNSNKQGELHVVETISLDFHANNHGIERAIPATYKGKSLNISLRNVSSPSGAPAQYTTYNSNDNLVVRIGDPNRTVTGAQSYIIDYSLTNVISFYEDHDELYWDVNGDQWRQPFTNVSATVHATGFTLNEPTCYAGSFGEQTTGSCSVQTTSDGFSTKVSNLAPGQTLTFVTTIPKGYFHPITVTEWIRQHLAELIVALTIPIVTGWWALRRWLAHGKDPDGRGVTVPEYDVPKHLTPAEAAVINSNKLEPKAATATIIDLAIRKYLRIQETTKQGLFKKSKTYQLVLLNTDWSALRAHESSILTAVFPEKALDETVDVKQIKTFYKTFEDLKTSLPESLTAAGYYAANPIKAGRGMIVLGIVIGVVGFISQRLIIITGTTVASGLLIVLGFLMPKRTNIGTITREHIQGLKLYLSTAEADRIKMMQSPDAPYAPKSPGPVKTVELFEKLLPFAIVLGVEKAWAKEFKDIYQQPPDWYTGNWTAFNTAVFASSLNSSMSSMTTSFSPPSSSGGSGSGGGGFSGGGGGGGGGGGW